MKKAPLENKKDCLEIKNDCQNKKVQEKIK